MLKFYSPDSCIMLHGMYILMKVAKALHEGWGVLRQ